MSNLRRYFKEGDISFITSVTHNRNPILITNISHLQIAINSITQKYKSEIIAHAILKDHFHIIIDPKGNDITKIIQGIKMSFGSLYRKVHSMKSGKVWQNRYWDHIIRNQDDLNKHIDYIHYNPVKHGYVMSPFDWEFSSINIFRKQGLYQDDWGIKDKIEFNDEFGE